LKTIAYSITKMHLVRNKKSL